MVEFIHKLTGTRMLVADERADEYKAAGHKLAAPQKSAEEPKEQKKKKG